MVAVVYRVKLPGQLKALPIPLIEEFFEAARRSADRANLGVARHTAFRTMRRDAADIGSRRPACARCVAISPFMFQTRARGEPQHAIDVGDGTSACQCCAGGCNPTLGSRVEPIGKVTRFYRITNNCGDDPNNILYEVHHLANAAGLRLKNSGDGVIGHCIKEVLLGVGQRRVACCSFRDPENQLRFLDTADYEAWIGWRSGGSAVCRVLNFARASAIRLDSGPFGVARGSFVVARADCRPSRAASLGGPMPPDGRQGLHAADRGRGTCFCWLP